MDIREHIRGIPDFPKPGILFYDISTLIAHPEAWQITINQLAKLVGQHQPDILAGIEARGFLVAAPLALKLGLGLVMVRKEGKLPWKTLREEYLLEYGSGALEMHIDSLEPGQRVLIVDDILIFIYKGFV